MAWQWFMFGGDAVSETPIHMEGPGGTLSVDAAVDLAGLLSKITIINTTTAPHEVVFHRSGGQLWKSEVVQPSEVVELFPDLSVTLLADIQSITARMV